MRLINGQGNQSYGSQFQPCISSLAIGFDGLQIFRVLGEGAFGAVHSSIKKDIQGISAMNEMDKRKVKFCQSEKTCLTDKNVLQKLSSPFALSCSLEMKRCFRAS